MNRVAVHQSVVHPYDPIELTGLLAGSDWDSIGLHVGAVPEVEPWWSGGAGERNLERLVDRLLETRVTVLDVGRVLLGGVLPQDEVHAAHGRVLDLGARFGARYVTARFGGPSAAAAERADVFGQLADQARPYRLVPLLAPLPVRSTELLEQAVAVVAPSGGGVVLDVPVGDCTPEDVEVAVELLGERLGYVRLSARRVDEFGERNPGMLATLPPHVPVAIGGDDSVGLLAHDPDPGLRRLHRLVDEMLEHPRARARRLGGA